MRSPTKQKGRTTRPRRSPLGVILAVGAAALLLLIGWYAWSGTQRNSLSPDSPPTAALAGQGSAEMPHIHGLGFSPDGRELFVAAHDGLLVFADGAWRTPDIPAHDYMGYSSTDSGFYSSGHPHTPGQINPFGLIKSTDGGKTLTKLGFEGESDFHVMGVGYRSHAIYVFNPASNSKLSAGLHYSLDDGKTWKQSAMQGVTAQPIQIAVHPTDLNVVALATEGGLMLSVNAGASFERVGPAGPVPAAVFRPNGNNLVFASTTLSIYDLAAQRVTALPMPANVGNDGVSAIAINPMQSDEIVFATFERNMYHSTDGGQAWQQIAQAGKGIAVR